MAETGIQNNVLLSMPRGGAWQNPLPPPPQTRVLRVCRNCHIKMDDLFVLLIYCATASGPPRLVEGNCCHRRWSGSPTREPGTGYRIPSQDIEYAQCMAE